MGIIQSLFPAPTEEFPPTGVRSVDNIVNDVKLIITTVEKPEKMMNEFKYRQMNVAPPAEATELINQSKSLMDTPGQIVKANSKIVEEVPKILSNPSAILADPVNFMNKMKELLGDPNILKQNYQIIIDQFGKVSENATNLVNSIPNYVNDYKKLVQEDYQQMVDYLNSLPEMVPIIEDAIVKMNTFEESLKAEMSKFSGGLCSAARSMQLIKRNLESLQKYKKKYEEELGVAKEIVVTALEKKKEVEGLITQAQAYQKQAEDMQVQILATKTKVEQMQKDAQGWIQKVQDLQNKEGEMKNLADKAKNMAENAFGVVKGFF